MQKVSTPIRLGRHRSIAAISAILVLVPMSDSVVAHSNWISRNKYLDPISGAWCCDENDCSVLEAIEVRETAGGFLVAGQYFVSRQRALPSNDSDYWACFNSEGQGAHDRVRGVRCFFAPMSS